MQPFKDKTGHEWRVVITFATCRYVRDTCGVNLTEPAGGVPPLATRLPHDALLAVDVLHAVCGEQCDAEDVTPGQFAERLSGEPYQGALAALMQEWANFCRSLGRVDHAALVEANWQLTLVAAKAGAEHIQATDLEAQVRNRMGKILKELESTGTTNGAST